MNTNTATTANDTRATAVNTHITLPAFGSLATIPLLTPTSVVPALTRNDAMEYLHMPAIDDFLARIINEHNANTNDTNTREALALEGTNRINYFFANAWSLQIRFGSEVDFDKVVNSAQNEPHWLSDDAPVAVTLQITSTSMTESERYKGTNGYIAGESNYAANCIAIDDDALEFMVKSIKHNIRDFTKYAVDNFPTSSSVDNAETISKVKAIIAIKFAYTKFANGIRENKVNPENMLMSLLAGGGEDDIFDIILKRQYQEMYESAFAVIGEGEDKIVYSNLDAITFDALNADADNLTFITTLRHNPDADKKMINQCYHTAPLTQGMIDYTASILRDYGL